MYTNEIDLSALKPKCTPDELVQKMKNKGITFNEISEETAKMYLKERNNYFRLCSYKRNYDKYPEGRTDEYIKLDFAYLLELSTIDMHLRYLFLHMSIDIEHFLKVKLLSDITSEDDEDGYSIAKDFLGKNHWVLEDIYHKRNSPYVGDLISNYFLFDLDEEGKLNIANTKVSCPIWALMEVLGFGEFIALYDFFYSGQPQSINVGTLNLVKSLRNACAHNNCVIYNLRKNSSTPGKLISDFISKIPSINKSERKSKLSVRPILEAVSLLYIYEKTVPEPIKTERYSKLKDLVYKRMRKKDYFQSNELICASYNFFKKLVDFLC